MTLTAIDRIAVPLAKRLIRQFGKAVVYTRVLANANLGTSTLGPASGSPSVAPGVTIRVTPPAPYKVRPDSPDGARTAIGLLECYASTADAGFQTLVTANNLTTFAPRMGDYLTIDGQTFRLAGDSGAVMSGNVAALYRFVWEGGGYLPPAQVTFSPVDQ